MASRGGISGVAVALAAGAGLVLWSGIRGESIADTIKMVATGGFGSPGESTVGATYSGVGDTAAIALGGAIALSSSGVAQHPEIAADAARYLGVPYQIGAANPTGAKPRVDCSGLVTWVLHHDFGLTLPNNNHTVTQQFIVWSAGSRVIPRAQCAAGDLVCWSGHIGIATSNTEMINAPHAGTVVRYDKIWKVPAPVVRRVILPGNLPPAPGKGASVL